MSAILMVMDQVLLDLYRVACRIDEYSLQPRMSHNNSLSKILLKVNQRGLYEVLVRS